MVGLLFFGILGTLTSISIIFLLRIRSAENRRLKFTYIALAILPFSEIILNNAIFLYVKISDKPVLKSDVIKILEEKNLNLRHQTLHIPSVAHLIGCKETSMEKCIQEYANIINRGVAENLFMQITKSERPYFKTLDEHLNLDAISNHLIIYAGSICKDYKKPCYSDEEFQISIEKAEILYDRLKKEYENCQYGKILFYKYVKCEKVLFTKNTRSFVSFERIVGIDYPLTLGFLGALDFSDIHRPSVVASLNWLTGETVSLNIDRNFSINLNN